MSNQQIAELFRNVAAAYVIKDEIKFRFQIIAYQKAASAIENSTREVEDLITQNLLDSIPGIGPSIRDHLEELKTEGKVRHFDWVFKGIPESVFSLLKIPSFGPKTAYKLVDVFHLNNSKTVVDDLLKIAEKGKIAKLQGFGDKSQTEIKLAILEYKKGMNKTRRMSLPFASKLAEEIVDYMKKSKAVLRIDVLGSLRRMVSTIGDIDLSVSTNNPKEVMRHFIEYSYKERILDKGDISSSIIVSGGHQIDLKIQPADRYGSLLQHFTGSKNHNIRLREYALRKGLSLSEYGIKKLSDKKGQIIKYSSEEKFYNDLGMSWIPPELRENNGEIELAIKDELPNLIELSDIRGDLHIHSSFSVEPSHDLGKNTMEDMLLKAKLLGYEYLGFSEHNPSVSKHSRKEIHNLIETKKKKIEKINSSKKYVRAFNLLEIDINPNGNLAIDDDALEILDCAIVSVHTVFGLEKKAMTERIIKGLSHKKAKILAHPTGRLINKRDGYDLDWEKLFIFCYKNNKALEINSWPDRLDLNDVLIRRAIDNKVKLVINTDSHATYQMDNMKYGVSLARRGWAKKSDIINSFSYNDLREWFNK